MRNVRSLAALALGLALATLACDGPSDNDCRYACKKAASKCTDPSMVVDHCVERCLKEADPGQVQDVEDRCGNEPTCRAGLCCAGFYYSEIERDVYCK